MGGTQPGPDGGGTQPGPDGGLPSQVQMEGGYLTRSKWGVPCRWGYPARRSTSYVVGGKPLAFMQEDFLVTDVNKLIYWTD